MKLGADTLSIISPRIALAYWGSFVVPMNFRIAFSSSVKNVIGIVMGTALILQIAFQV